MAKKPELERVGGGTYDVYREKKKSFWDSVGEIIGGVIVVGIGLAVIGAIVG